MADDNNSASPGTRLRVIQASVPHPLPPAESGESNAPVSDRPRLVAVDPPSNVIPAGFGRRKSKINDGITSISWQSRVRPPLDPDDVA
jgi:hypothetical protein